MLLEQSEWGRGGVGIGGKIREVAEDQLIEVDFKTVSLY